MSARPEDVKAILEKALEISEPDARAAYLNEACGSDDALRAEIDELLNALDRAGKFLNRSGPPGDAATGPFDASDPSRPNPVEAITGTFNAGSPNPESDGGANELLGMVIAGRYKLVEAIGEGGMGNVFLAQQTEPVKRLVALKVIKAGMDSKAVLARFEAERQALAMMDHPNIARVLDAGTTENGRPFFVMELVKGVPITKFSDDRKLTPRERLNLFVPVCHAIQHAHQKGVIHRDIKPNNVLVAMYDDRPVPKVIDFGVAKATGAQLAEHTLITGFGAVVGTPEYMSPEQASFNQMDVDTRSDVYALGVLLYELLTGSPPFSRKELEKVGLMEIFRVIREQEPRRPSNRLSTSDGLPTLAANRQTEPRRLTAMMKGELDWIVMKALEKDRSRRYETANGFAADVQRYLAGEAVQAVPPSGWYRFKKTLRRNRGVVIATTLVFCALVCGMIGTSIGLIRAESAKQAEEQQRIRAEQERDDKEQARKDADEQRKRAEYQVASIGIDLDMEGGREPKIELLRLARRLPMIPDNAPELREFIVRRMLVVGQKLRALVVSGDSLSFDGQYLLRYVGGARALREIRTGRQIAIWPDSVTFVAGGSLILRQVSAGPVELWDTSGRRVMSTPPFSGIVGVQVSSDGQRVLTISYNTGHYPQKITGVQLWDGHSGKLVGTLPIAGSYVSGVGPGFILPNRVMFSPDSAILATALDGVVRIWSAADGQLVRELGRFYMQSVQGELKENIADLSFSPKGHSLALFDGDGKLHRWRVADWELNTSWIPINQTYFQSSIRWHGEDLVGIHSSEQSPSGVNQFTLLNGHKLPADVERVQGNIALANDRQLFDLTSGRRIMVPIDKRFPPEISQFATDNRFLIEGPGIYDLEVSKSVVFSVDKYLFSDPVRAAHWLWLDVDMGMGGHTTEAFPVGALPTPESVILWANVAARGELDQFGEFIPWDERKWEDHRQRLANSIPVGEADDHFRPAIHDRLYWLRQEIDEALAAHRDPLPLLDRLIAVEPTWENYAARAATRHGARQYDLAIRDALEASRLAGVVISPFQSYPQPDPIWSIVQSADLPREHYELALRWFRETSRATGIEDTWRTLALLLYRLGRYKEALARLDQDESRGVSEFLGRVVLTGSTATSSPLHSLCVCADSNNQISEPEIYHGLRAMCHYKLGEKALAKTHLAAAAVQQKMEDKKPNLSPGPGGPPQAVMPGRPALPGAPGRREIPYYREATELINGKQPSK